MGEDGICIVNLLEIPRVIVFFFKQKTAYEIGVRLVGSEMCIRDRRSFVLSSEHENQNVATIGTL